MEPFGALRRTLNLGAHFITWTWYFVRNSFYRDAYQYPIYRLLVALVLLLVRWHLASADRPRRVVVAVCACVPAAGRGAANGRLARSLCQLVWDVHPMTVVVLRVPQARSWDFWGLGRDSNKGSSTLIITDLLLISRLRFCLGVSLCPELFVRQWTCRLLSCSSASSFSRRATTSCHPRSRCVLCHSRYCHRRRNDKNVLFMNSLYVDGDAKRIKKKLNIRLFLGNNWTS